LPQDISAMMMPRRARRIGRDPITEHIRNIYLTFRDYASCNVPR
jgi:hypothetical protein